MGQYFHRERRVVKVEDFINLKQGNMSVEEYSWKFTMLSKYTSSSVSNLMDDMSRVVTGVSEIVRE